MIPSEYARQIDNLLDLMQIAMDGTCCDNQLSIPELTKRINSFKIDFQVYQKAINSWKRKAEVSPEALVQLEAKLETARVLLHQLDAELKTLIWKKENQEK